MVRGPIEDAEAFLEAGLWKNDGVTATVVKALVALAKRAKQKAWRLKLLPETPYAGAYGVVVVAATEEEARCLAAGECGCTDWTNRLTTSCEEMTKDDVLVDHGEGLEA